MTIASGSPGYAFVGYVPAASGLHTVAVTATNDAGLSHFPAGIAELTTAIPFRATN